MKHSACAFLLAAVAASVSAQDQSLVFVSVNPCVIFDTRPAFSTAGPFAADQTRTYFIAGSTADFPAQGGTAGGCGVPAWTGGQPVARAVFMNYVAIDAQGAGQIKAWASDKTEPEQGALVNYQALTPPMNNSNGVITELRQDAPGADITVRARSAGVHVRGVILGYFTRDHIAGVIAGTGLTGGGPSGNITVGIADGGVTPQQINAFGSTSGHVLRSNGTSAQWQAGPTGARGPTGPTGATGGTGAIGTAGIGTVRPIYTTAIVDLASDVHAAASITIGTDGLGLISYNGNGERLSVAHCLNVECTASTTSDIGSDSAAFNSIAIGVDGFGLISYHNKSLSGNDNDLKVAHCSNLECSSATITTLDETANVGAYSSIAIGSDGLGLISYYDETNDNLKVAHCSDVICSAATITTLGSSSGINPFTSITIGSDGLGLIGFNGGVAHCTNLLCSSATISPGGGAQIGRTIGPDGHPLYTHGTSGNYTGPPFENDVRALFYVSHCVEPACTSVVTSLLETFDRGDAEAPASAITIGSDGMGLIAYYDPVHNRLKTIHLSNALGTRMVRRR